MFLLQVTRQSISVLQVTRESKSGTTSHVCFVWTCDEIKGFGKDITRLLPLALLLILHTRNDTDGNKVAIISGLALYYGDTYVLSYVCPTHANVWESMGKPCSCMQFKLFFLLQITRECVSGVASHMCYIWTCNGLYDEIITIPPYFYK